MQLNHLTEEERHVIEGKGTEPPYTGEYDDFYEAGTFICRRCNAPLFSSQIKFDAGCGWPAFDAFIAGSVNEVPDPDGERTEIECAACHAHLGHVFIGEKFTKTDARHCVNSLSLQFVPQGEK
ncbi:MAG: methionine-R-sulfoxide reductase [Patescibacteria group bacterium]